MWLLGTTDSMWEHLGKAATEVLCLVIRAGSLLGPELLISSSPQQQGRMHGPSVLPHDNGSGGCTWIMVLGEEIGIRPHL